jgi:putative FmdB family regulatory protein
MPIYEYACSGCGHELEAWQKISEKPKKACPICHARKLERLISNTSFQLKGTGWYVTDYAKKDKKDPSSQSAKESRNSDKSSKSSESGKSGKSSKSSKSSSDKKDE